MSAIATVLCHLAPPLLASLPGCVQDFFAEQFSAESSGPLLAVLRTLDGERVAGALARVQVGPDTIVPGFPGELRTVTMVVGERVAGALARVQVGLAASNSLPCGRDH